MGLNLNFSGVEDGFPKLSEGDHTLVIENVDVKESAAGNSTNIIVDMVASGGVDDGKKLRSYINVQDSTMWRVKQFFVALTGDEDIEEINLDDPSILLGQTIGATVSFDGQYNQVDAWFTA